MARQSNYDHLQAMEPYQLASAILDISETVCELCHNDACSNDCAAGLTNWLLKPYDQREEVWQGRNLK